MKVLALDQAPLNTGWAIGTPCDGKPVWGVFTLPTWGNHEGERLLSFWRWLRTTLADNEISHCFYEDYVEVRGKSYDVAMKQGMQIGIIELLCAEMNIPLKVVPVAAWRTRFLGTTKATPGLKGVYEAEDLKQKALRACALRGWLVEEHHAAEALGILDYGCCTLSKKHAGAADPIFRRAQLKEDESWIRQGGRL